MDKTEVEIRGNIIMNLLDRILDRPIGGVSDLSSRGPGFKPGADTSVVRSYFVTQALILINLIFFTIHVTLDVTTALHVAIAIRSESKQLHSLALCN